MTSSLVSLNGANVDVPPAEPVCGFSVTQHAPLTLGKSPRTDYKLPCSPSVSPRSVWSKLDRDLTRALDAPIWSRITANPDHKNRHVISCVEATLGTTARAIPRTWVRSGVFHNTIGETSLMRDQMGHDLSENDLRLPHGRFAPLGCKWSCSVAQTAEDGRMRPDPPGRKPSRFPNKTPRAGPGPPH